jgi:CheY-like chemotaxis protein/HPt (histidine-containing phosphotransfer) domain-containing protein
MSSLRVLHVDDESDIREVVEIALGLDPDFSVQGCASGADALKAAAQEVPDLILLDVMMPGMDGPTTLAHLRQSDKTVNIPVVFMTARAQMRELEHFRSLGAAGVIAKPFDPMTLAAAVRSYSQAARIASLRSGFVLRARQDAVALAACRRHLADPRDLSATLADIRTLAHGLAGAAGIYGFAEISDAAGALENAVIAELTGGRPGQAGQALDRLLALLASLGDAKSESTSH